MSERGGNYVVLNGEIVAADEARVPVDDRGFLYGESVFTTLRCYKGRPFRLDRHVARLNASLRSPVVGIDYVLNEAAVRNDIARLVQLSGCPDAVVRLRVTRGQGAGPLPPHDCRPAALLTVDPLKLDESIYERGVKLIVSSVRRDAHGELAKHKLGSYFGSLLARRQAAEQGADEAVIRDTDDNWLECACSNLFVVAGGTLITPPTTQNLLPGIARETVLECAEALSIPISEEPLTARIAERAEEAFITNSVQEVVPVAEADGQRLSQANRVARTLMQAYRALTQSA
jgi:branched-chain amino acid aminotransferase